jgi:hypothetical protein
VTIWHCFVPQRSIRAFNYNVNFFGESRIYDVLEFLVSFWEGECILIFFHTGHLEIWIHIFLSKSNVYLWYPVSLRFVAQ